MYNYSIIIPHYNNVEDLKRCLDSIPERDDVQVIVIDDNSDPQMVDFTNFPGVGRRNVEVVFSKGENGKGPGYARNVGIEHAKGKWIVFSDSDDYFFPQFNQIMNQYLDSNAEIVFFKCKKENLEHELSDYFAVNDLIDQSRKDGNADPIAYGFPCPWGKFVKRDFLENNNIRFQQITGGDDILFSVRMAVKLKRYELANESLYCVVDRPGSLTRNNQWRGFSSYTLACCEAYKMMNPVGKGKMAFSWTASWWGRLRAESKFRALMILPQVVSVMGISKALHCYKKAMKVERWNWKNREK